MNIVIATNIGDRISLPNSYAEYVKFQIKGLNRFINFNEICSSDFDKIDEWIIQNISWLPIDAHYPSNDRSFRINIDNIQWAISDDDIYYNQIKSLLQSKGVLSERSNQS